MPDIFAGQGKAGGVRLYTIGFTKTTAADFFGRLQSAGVQRIVDVRLNPDGQLSGFAKRDDLAFFAERLCGIGYRHAPELAPTKPMFDEYKKLKGPWPDYEAKFLKLIAERHIETTETPADLDLHLPRVEAGGPEDIGIKPILRRVGEECQPPPFGIALIGAWPNNGNASARLPCGKFVCAVPRGVCQEFRIAPQEFPGPAASG